MGAGCGGRGQPWRRRLSDSLDQAILRTPLRARRPIWWLVVNVIQWALGLTAVLGLLWFVLIWVLGLLQLPRADVPLVLGVLPVPLVMVVGGLLVGLGLGLVSRWWAKVGARHRKKVVARRLTDAIGIVADDQLLIPIDEVLARHRETRDQLTAAGA